MRIYKDPVRHGRLTAIEGRLSEPGDKLEARVTNSNRKVVKIQKDNGNSKYSATQYPNGTVVETKVTKRK